MTGLAAMVALGVTCWALRVMFVVVVPAERLPARVREALDHLAPAVLAALVTVETVAVVRGDGLITAGLVVGSVLLIGLVVRHTGNLALAVALAAGAALLIDLT